MRSPNMRVMLLSAAVLLLVLSQQVAASSRHDDDRDKDRDKDKDKDKGCRGRGFASCKGACVNTDSNTTHCGACNRKCMSGFTCVNGACTCSGEKIVCNVGGAPSCVSDSSACATCLPPEPVYEVTCMGSIQPQPLNNSNGCSVSTKCGAGASQPGGFCSSTDESTWANGFTAAQFCGCNPAPGSCGAMTYCAFAEKRLCYESCCDRNGTINIKGASLSSCSAASEPNCRCGGTDDLYVFATAVPDTVSDSTSLVYNQAVVDFSVNCNIGQCFLLCENNGVIMADTVATTLTFTALGSCPAGSEEVSRRIESCGGMPDAR